MERLLIWILERKERVSCSCFINNIHFSFSLSLLVTHRRHPTARIIPNSFPKRKRLHGNSLNHVFPSSHSSEICRYIKCITWEGEHRERGEDESIFTPEKASFRCDVSITPFIKIFSCAGTFGAWNLKRKFRSMMFFRLTNFRLSYTHIDWNIVECHQKINQIMYFLLLSSSTLS